MELNTNYYTNVTEDATAGTRFSQFTGLPLNTSFDLSGAYALQGGAYAPFCNLIEIRGGDISTLTTHYDLTQHNREYTYQYKPLFLGTQHCGYNLVFNSSALFPMTYTKNRGWDVCSRAKNYNYTSQYHWSPYATNLTTAPLSGYYTGNMVCGFSYRDVVLDVRIFRAYSTLPDLSAGNTTFDGTNAPAGQSTYTGSLADWNPETHPYVTQLMFVLYAARKAGVQPSGSSNNRYHQPEFAHNGANYTSFITSPFEENFQKIEVSLYQGNYVFDDITEQFSPAYNLCSLGANGQIALSSAGYLIGGGTSTTAPYGAACIVPFPQFLKNNYTEGYSRTHYWWEFSSKEDIYKIAATFGLYFTDDGSAAQVVTGSAATSEHLFLPVFDDDGVYRGKYVSGTDIKDAPNADWGGSENPWDWWKDNGVSPKPTPSGDETDKTPLSKPAISAFGSFNRAYAMTQTTLNDLQNYLWNVNETVFDEIVAGLKLFGENPLNAIIDCRMYPFDVLSYIGSTGAQKITLGRRESSVTGVYLGNTTNCIIDCGSVYWARYTDTFLDYSPYSSGELYVPYIGRFSLDPNVYCGHTVQAYVIVDFMTGGAQCVVYSDGIAHDYKAGQIGVDIPISGVNAAQWAAGIVGGIAGTTNGALSTVGSIAAGNPIGALSSGVSTMSAAVQTSAAATPSLQQSATATSAAAQWLPQQAYLTVHVPISAESSTYGSTVGYACQKTAAIGSVAGYTVCANVHLDSSFATQAERDEIVSLLTSGIYV